LASIPSRLTGKKVEREGREKGKAITQRSLGEDMGES